MNYIRTRFQEPDGRFGLVNDSEDLGQAHPALRFWLEWPEGADDSVRRMDATYDPEATHTYYIWVVGEPELALIGWYENFVNPEDPPEGE